MKQIQKKYGFFILLAFLTMVLIFSGSFLNISGQAQGATGAPSEGRLTPKETRVALTEEERAWLAAHPVIRVVQDPGWPPVEFADEKGEPSGMSEDYLKLIEARLGIRFERVRNLSWQEAYGRLQRHEIDMTTSVAATPDREKFWLFTKPYMKMPIVIFAQNDVTYLGDMRELAGKQIAVVDGYSANELIQRDFPDIHQVKVKNVKEGLDLVQQGKAFAFIDNMLVGGYYLTKLKITNVKIAGETPYINAQSLAVRKDWPVLARILQKTLDSISETERAYIYQKWLPIRYQHGFDYTMLWYALGLFVLVLSGLVAWNWKLSREIKARENAEKELAAGMEKFKLVFESANVGKSMTLPTGEIEVNRAFCDMLGYSREELKNKKWQELTPPDEIEAIQKKLDQLLQGQKDSVRFIKRYIHKNGSFIWADVACAIHRDRDHHPMFFITTAIDITESRKDEEKVRYAHDRLMRFINSNIVGVVIAAADGKIIEANDSYLNIAGFNREEFEQGKIDWRAITPREWLPADEQAIRELREKGVCSSYEKEYQRRDGTRVSVLLSLTILSGPEEQIAAFVLDITERKQAEKEVLRLNGELEQKVVERTAELRETIAQLEETNRVFVGRELRMAELKERIVELEKK